MIRKHLDPRLRPQGAVARQIIFAPARRSWFRSSGRLAIGLACAAQCLVSAELGQLPATTNNPPENWGKWGPNDEIGTLNYITPEVVRHAASMVKQGKVFGLGVPYDMKSPRGSTRVIQHYMTSTAQGAGQKPGFAEDVLTTISHGTTHWDGIGHMFAHGKLYNGYDVETNAIDRGLLKCGIHKTSDKVVTRGVLIDLARHFGVRHLASDHLITVADVEGAARKQGVAFRQGDVILIHSGWEIVWYEQGMATFWRASPGIGWEVSQWLKKIKASAFGSDTDSNEIIPCEPDTPAKVGVPGWKLPIHVELNRNQGMLLGDHIFLTELAKDCATDGVYEFMFVGPPLNLLNGTGSPINPLAIK